LGLLRLDGLAASRRWSFADRSAASFSIASDLVGFEALPENVFKVMEIDAPTCIAVRATYHDG